MEAKYYGRPFPSMPTIIVIHSGASRPNVAEFFQRTGRVWSKKHRKWILVSAHLSWSAEWDDFVQCVPLSHVAFHAGGSRLQWRGKLITHLNFHSYGLELPGPPRANWPSRILDRLRYSMVALKEEARPAPLQVVVRHLDVDSNKRDPGRSEQIYECLYDLDLEMPFHKAG